MGGCVMSDNVTLDELIRALENFRRDDRAGSQPVSLYCGEEFFEIDNIKFSDGVEIRIK